MCAKVCVGREIMKETVCVDLRYSLEESEDNSWAVMGFLVEGLIKQPATWGQFQWDSYCVPRRWVEFEKEHLASTCWIFLVCVCVSQGCRVASRADWVRKCRRWCWFLCWSYRTALSFTSPAGSAHNGSRGPHTVTSGWTGSRSLVSSGKWLDL